jgi:aminoglycoside phosphotransferase family enzyme
VTIPQAPVAALLRRLSGAEPIETHISAVYVGAETAWKLKKAVRLGFLDFSTLEARERFARRELALNQPLAPGLYRDLVAVTRAPDGTLALDGDGEVVDWVLRMAPVPAADFLDAVADRGGLTGAMQDAMADAVLASHQAAVPAPDGFDAPAAAARVLAGNIRDCRATGLPEPRVAALGSAMEARLAALAPRLAARAAAGRGRRCHGDLHLGNLVLLDGRPTPFDALEFDEALATTDTGYDLAFLLMDLLRRGARPAANRVLNRYLARDPDLGLLPALPFWMALRAMVRAHVEARRGGDGLAYLAAAEAHLAPVPPRLVAIGGLQGTGKTWLARDLAPDLGIAPGALHLNDSHFPTEPPPATPEQLAVVEARMRRAGMIISHNVLTEATTPHIASPDMHVDHANRRIIMYFHGLEGVGHQASRVALSPDGITFQARPEIRVFPNPSADASLQITSSVPMERVEVYTAAGVLVQQNALSGLSWQAAWEQNIPSSGVYFVNVTLIGGTTYSHRWLIP